ncbi:hypothetical protein [Erwinia piriflorinigrans]|uniref:Uncharacterized protein n=1 Tax=Erwinia piriflorinigrans CFBP 5888 TaxID=1161919 RepID=V5ZD33_9GAMM|nr:hypothetical protein [Erwinia piriflorinigrans]CCG88894.1 hypothetical protein EPIR_3531 [Erwinia piriflorinigrans CFBP 5888]
MSDDFIYDRLSIRVPEQYDTIQQALDFLKGKVIVSGVDIWVSDGEYEISSPIRSEVIYSDRLTIRGNESDPSKCVINVDNSNSVDGFLFSNGCGVSWLNGFTIRGQRGFISKGQWNEDCYGSGIRAVNSMVTLGGEIVIEKMYYGIRAMNGAFITNETAPKDGKQGGGIKVYYAGDAAYHAFAASIKVSCAEAYDTAHDPEGLGFGFCAESGGFLSCEYAISNGNLKAGYYALSSGSVWAHGVSASSNMYGVLSWGGSIECNKIGEYDSTFSFNEAGIYATYNGFIGANGAYCVNNNIGVLSDRNSLIDITYVVSEKNTNDGFKCDIFGVMSGFNVTSQNNGGDGFHCTIGSKFNIVNAQSLNNSGNGYFSAKNSIIFVEGLYGEGNLTGFCTPERYSLNPQGGNDNSLIFDI